MALFGLGINSNKYWFFLFAFLFYLFRSYLFSPELKCQPCNSFIKVILMSLGMSLGLIFEYISKQRQISLRTYKDTYKLNNILFIFSLNLFDLIGFFLLNYLQDETTSTFYGSDEIHILIQFFFVAIFLFLFHQLIMHKHHIFFTIMMVIGLLIICLSNVISSDKNKTLDIENLLWLILSSLLYSFLLVGEKYLMEKKFVSPYMIIGFEGIFGFVVTVCIIVVLKIFGINSFIIDFEKEEGKFTNAIFIFNMILFVLSSLGYNVFVMLINQFFGANNRVVCDFITVFCRLIINWIFGFEDKMKNYDFLIVLIGHCIVLIGVVGFNEIIIFYFCGLDVYTNQQIQKRATYYEGMSLDDSQLIAKSKVIQLTKKNIHLDAEEDDDHEENTQK